MCQQRRGESKANLPQECKHARALPFLHSWQTSLMDLSTFSLRVPDDHDAPASPPARLGAICLPIPSRNWERKVKVRREPGDVGRLQGKEEKAHDPGSDLGEQLDLLCHPFQARDWGSATSSVALGPPSALLGSTAGALVCTHLLHHEEPLLCPALFRDHPGPPASCVEHSPLPT